jgi:hypothetical protein
MSTHPRRKRSVSQQQQTEERRKTLKTDTRSWFPFHPSFSSSSSSLSSTVLKRRRAEEENKKSETYSSPLYVSAHGTSVALPPSVFGSAVETEMKKEEKAGRRLFLSNCFQLPIALSTSCPSF